MAGHRECFNILILEDDIFEKDVEIFSVSLITTNSSINIYPYRGDVGIRDNESKERGRVRNEKLKEMKLQFEGTIK